MPCNTGYAARSYANNVSDNNMNHRFPPFTDMANPHNLMIFVKLKIAAWAEDAAKI